MRLSVCVFVALLAAVCVSSSLPLRGVSAQENATGKFFVHSKAIDFFQSIVNSLLENALENVSFPDDTVKVPGGHLDISAIVLHNVEFQAQQVGLVAPNQVTIDLNNFQGAVDLNWEYHGPLGIHFHGSADINFSQTSINTLFTFASDSVGRPVLTLTSTVVTIDDLDIKLHGGGAWLFNLIIKLLKKMLIHKLESTIDGVAVNEFNKVLAGIEAKYPLAIPLTGKLLGGAQLNLPLVPTLSSTAADATPRPFTMTSDYLVAAGEFGFSSTTNSTVDPRPHDWIPDSLPTNPSGEAPMLGFAFDEALLGSLLYTVTQNGKLDVSLNKMGDKFTTKTLAVEFPALYEKYPGNNLTLDISQYNNAPPTATASPQGSSWSDAFVIQINVVESVGQAVPVCQLLVNFTLNSVFNIVDNSTGAFATGRISPLEFSASILWSALDPAQFAGAVQGVVTALANDLLVPIIDSVLAKGIALPSTMGTFPVSNMFASYGSHVFSFGFDISMPADEQDAVQALIDLETL